MHSLFKSVILALCIGIGFSIAANVRTTGFLWTAPAETTDGLILVRGEQDGNHAARAWVSRLFSDGTVAVDEPVAYDSSGGMLEIRSLDVRGGTIAIGGLIRGRSLGFGKTITAVAADKEGFVALVDSSGALEWVSQASAEIDAVSIADDGAVLVGGGFQGTADVFGRVLRPKCKGMNGFFSTLDDTGHLAWTQVVPCVDANRAEPTGIGRVSLRRTSNGPIAVISFAGALTLGSSTIRSHYPETAAVIVRVSRDSLDKLHAITSDSTTYSRDPGVSISSICDAVDGRIRLVGTFEGRLRIDDHETTLVGPGLTAFFCELFDSELSPHSLALAAATASPQCAQVGADTWIAATEPTEDAELLRVFVLDSAGAIARDWRAATGQDIEAQAFLHGMGFMRVVYSGRAPKNDGAEPFRDIRVTTLTGGTHR